MRSLAKKRSFNIVLCGIEQFSSPDIASGNICLRLFAKIFVRIL